MYLPAEDLRRFGVVIVAGSPDAGLADAQQLERLCALVRFECERAREWFDRGIALTRMLDRRSAACVLAMAGIYRRLLARILRRTPRRWRAGGCRCPRTQKAWVAARGMLGVGA